MLLECLACELEPSPNQILEGYKTEKLANKLVILATKLLISYRLFYRTQKDKTNTRP
jgi:hypothetical protein